MDRHKRQQLNLALHNPLVLTRCISASGTWIGECEKMAEKLKSDRLLTTKVMYNFKSLSEKTGLNASFFTENNSTGITQQEFLSLTDPKSIEETEVGGPDDIFPWDKVSMIPSWKFAMLAIIFNSFCPSLPASNILKGQDIPYAKEKCERSCSEVCKRLRGEYVY